MNRVSGIIHLFFPSHCQFFHSSLNGLRVSETICLLDDSQANRKKLQNEVSPVLGGCRSFSLIARVLFALGAKTA